MWHANNGQGPRAYRSITSPNHTFDPLGIQQFTQGTGRTSSTQTCQMVTRPSTADSLEQGNGVEDVWQSRAVTKGNHEQTLSSNMNLRSLGWTVIKGGRSRSTTRI
jgi:hypothetical protein